MKTADIRTELNKLNDPSGLPSRVFDTECRMVAEWSNKDCAYIYPDGCYTYAFVVREDRQKFPNRRRFQAAPSIQKELAL